jgi:hypothetical protein
MKIINTNMFLQENIDYGLTRQKKDGEHLVLQLYGQVFLEERKSLDMLILIMHQLLLNLLLVLVDLIILGQQNRQL